MIEVCRSKKMCDSIHLCTKFDIKGKNHTAMKTQLLLLMLIVSSLYSCTRSRYATVGAYESDDAYYTESDTYIADFALVDDEAQMATSTDSSSTTSSSDDYYDPNYSAPNAYSPNVHSNSWSPDPWNSCGNSFGSGFGNYNYGNYWNNNPYMIPNIGWNPYSGYYTNYSFVYGNNPYFNPYCSSSFGYNPYGSWYTPYYSPYYYSGWAYNPWNSPFNYYNVGGNDTGTGGSIVHGPRTPISSISATSSSYSTGLFYSGTKRKTHSYVNELETTGKPTQPVSRPADRPEGTKPASPATDRPSVRPTSGRPAVSPAAPRPTYTPSKPNYDRPAVKPGRETTPKPDRFNPTPPKRDAGKGTMPRTDSPVRDQKPSAQPAAPTRQRSETPSRETTRPAPRTESTPSRSSSTPSTPARPSGGSTNSPRRK